MYLKSFRSFLSQGVQSFLILCVNMLRKVFLHNSQQKDTIFVSFFLSWKLLRHSSINICIVVCTMWMTCMFVWIGFKSNKCVKYSKGAAKSNFFLAPTGALSDGVLLNFLQQQHQLNYVLSSLLVSFCRSVPPEFLG